MSEYERQLSVSSLFIILLIVIVLVIIIVFVIVGFILIIIVILNSSRKLERHCLVKVWMATQRVKSPLTAFRLSMNR